MAVAESLTNLVFAPISCLEVQITYYTIQKLIKKKKFFFLIFIILGC